MHGVTMKFPWVLSNFPRFNLKCVYELVLSGGYIFVELKNKLNIMMAPEHLRVDADH